MCTHLIKRSFLQLQASTVHLARTGGTVQREWWVTHAHTFSVLNHTCIFFNESYMHIFHVLLVLHSYERTRNMCLFHFETKTAKHVDLAREFYQLSLTLLPAPSDLLFAVSAAWSPRCTRELLLASVFLFDESTAMVAVPQPLDENLNGRVSKISNNSQKENICMYVCHSSVCMFSLPVCVCTFMCMG